VVALAAVFLEHELPNNNQTTGVANKIIIPLEAVVAEAEVQAVHQAVITVLPALAAAEMAGLDHDKYLS
jgi:hypothetical protein